VSPVPADLLLAERIRPPPAEEHVSSRAPYVISIRHATVDRDHPRHIFWRFLRRFHLVKRESGYGCSHGTSANKVAMRYNQARY
jgi:hypothetical protein